MKCSRNPEFSEAWGTGDRFLEEATLKIDLEEEKQFADVEGKERPSKQREVFGAVWGDSAAREMGEYRWWQSISSLMRLWEW